MALRKSRIIRLSPLEHGILRDLRPFDLGRVHLLACVSGGLDSMVMIEVLYRLRTLLKFEMSVCHVHHGGSGKFRKDAQALVRRYCAEHDLPFITNPPKRTGASKRQSEADLRALRELELAKFVEKLTHQESKPVVLAKAHHLDDLLETRLLRLVRGVGPQGLSSMQMFDQKTLRPLLNLSRREIEKLAKQLDVDWLEDPSNKEVDYARNWMRHKWLPALEAKLPGAQKVLARSLDALVLAHHERDWSEVIVGRKIRMDQFLALTNMEKRECLFSFMKQVGIRDYGFRHVQEILKRLDNDRVELTFSLLKHQWKVNAQHISVS